MANIDITNSGGGNNVPQFYRQRSPGVYAEEVGISDVATGSGLFFSTDNELMMSARVSVLRGETNGTSVDTNLFTLTNSGSAGTTASGGEYHLTTGATAGSIGQLQTAQASRHYPGTTGYWIGVIRTTNASLGTGSFATWGFFNSNDGFYFNQQPNGVFAVGYRKAAVDTTIPYAQLNGVTSHFNPTTDLTKMNQFSIIHGGLSCRWQINGRTVHTIATNTITAPLTGALSLPSSISAINGTTEVVTVHCRGMSYSRLSPVSSVPVYQTFTTTQTGTTLRQLPARVVAVIINAAPAAASTLTMFDNTAASGTVIAALTIPTTLPAPIRLDYGVETGIGLTVSTSTALNFTILYE